MSYYTVLGLNREAFSTSPDPDFFYESKEHRAALMRLMIEIRLRRGLSVILGDVGVGKTTLSRKVFQMLKSREDVDFHMILDPTYESEALFLDSLARTLQIEMKTANPTILDFKERLKEYLFRKGMEERKTVVLLIDEAQKLNALSLEILRVLLNYETNEYKLLQVILLGQLELLGHLREMKNLWQRIGMKYVINNLPQEETRAMIEFRLRQAGYADGPALFTDEAIRQIYQYTQGYPRSIAMICHDALKELVMQAKLVIDGELVQGLIARENKFSGCESQVR